MAKQRYVNTKFWDDSYIIDLEPIEKLLFLYFLTNPLTNLCGAYEISLKRITFDTAIHIKEINKILEKFTKDKKILYIDGFVIIKNFLKNQIFTSPKVLKAIKVEISALPRNIQEHMDSIKIDYRYTNDSTSYLDIDLDIDLDLDRDIDISKKSKNLIKKEKTPSDIMKEFISSVKEKNKDYEALLEALKEKGIPRSISAAELEKFTDYWTEQNKSGTKERWQLEKTFEVRRRLTTWFNNIKKFNGGSRKIGKNYDE